MKGTRWNAAFAKCASALRREMTITLTPVVEPQCWAFIVGCYNSGTELLVKLLGSHPDVARLPDEGQFLTDQLPQPHAEGLPRMWVLREDLFRLTEEDVGPDVIRLKKEWISRLDRSRPVFLEKSPPNAARTRWLQRHFTNARFIAIVRNGYAVAEGIRRKARLTHCPEGWPLELCARQWARHHEVLLEDAPSLDYLQWIRYEDLTEDPGTVLEQILKFLCVDDGGETAIDRARSWSVHERSEPIRNMNAESIGRLSQEEIEIVTRVAGPMIEHFGYEPLS